MRVYLCVVVMLNTLGSGTTFQALWTKLNKTLQQMKYVFYKYLMYSYLVCVFVEINECVHFVMSFKQLFLM